MKFYTVLSDDVIQCNVCPRYCRLKKGRHGFCKIRENTGDRVELAAYAHITGLSVDPIEKKPLYHFYPSSKALSLGTYGCNMGCVFCQNWHISKTDSDPYKLPVVMPQEVINAAKQTGCKSIAFTYNDPVVFIEYALDITRIAKSEGIQTVAVSAGYINKEAREALFSQMDAVNIDLKAFSNKFYEKNCLADINTVLDTIKYIKNETYAWLELTTLLIEGENDSDDEIKRECNWIAENLGPNVPLHFSAFHPAYKFMHKSPTSYNALKRAYNIAQSCGLNYVYSGNVSDEETSTTYCKFCKNPVIVRDGYMVLRYDLDEFARCNVCCTLCNGIFI